MDNRLDLTIDKIYQLGNNGSEDLQAGLQKVYNATPLGPLSSNMVNTIYGINHRQTQLALPFNRDGYGLTLFTRPRLNLTTNNIRTVPEMYPLLNTEPRSIQRILRCSLDPELAFPDATYTKQTPVKSPYVDDLNMFIPFLTNLCTSISGWPDYVADTHTTPEGHYREAHSMIDSSIEIRNVYELSATFRNIPNNPVTLLFYFWLFYAAKVFEGEMIPYGSSLFEHEIDYNTRIYRLVLDPTKRYVQDILSTGASFPLNAPIGRLGDFDSSQPFNDANDTINIRFQSIGMEYNNYLQILDFNSAVAQMNPGMTAENRSQYYIQIPYQVLSFFNMRGYPQINTKTMELEWYVSYTMFNTYIKELEAVSRLGGIRDLSFLKYTSSSNAAQYQQSLTNLNTPTTDVRNGGVVNKALNGEYSQDELDQIAESYYKRGQ